MHISKRTHGPTLKKLLPSARVTLLRSRRAILVAVRDKVNVAILPGASFIKSAIKFSIGINNKVDLRTNETHPLAVWHRIEQQTHA